MAVQNLSKSFGDRVLFSDVELTVGGDERIALLGDNGTGKSTFLKILLGEEITERREDQIRSIGEDGVFAPDSAF